MSERTFWQLLGGVFLVYLAGMRVNVMDVDAAQYAAMSREMLESGSYLQVFEQGHDYLDKPPLLFWLSSSCMKFLGVNNFAYKFPSLIFALLAIFSTHRFSELFYNKTTAQLAALVLATSQALFLITNDCRADTLLMGCVAFTFWQLSAAFLTDKWQHFLLGFVGIGVGLLAKGPVALIIPALGFTAHFIWKKDFKQFLRVEYLWGLVVIGVILLPMIWGLYQQFDLHPEKIIDGKTGVSGLRFFFWTQSFGRITGENTWNNNAGFGFLFQNMLWSFAPWILYLVAGIIASILNAFKKTQLIENQEFITTGGVILGYLSLAASKYQLPHYIFVVYPLAAVITARFLHAILYKNEENKESNEDAENSEDEKNSESESVLVGKILNSVQWILITILWGLPATVLIFVFPAQGIPLAVTGILVTILVISAFQKKSILFSSIYTALIINLFLNIFFYPTLLKYQYGSEVGKKIRLENVANDKFFTFKYQPTSSLHFYSRRIVQVKENVEEVKPDDWLLTDEKGLQVLQDEGLELDFKETGNTFPVTNLNSTFLYAKTRSEVVGQYFLVVVK